jgi:copper chaperone CopZ
MVKITATVEGMMCGMCEAHVNDAVRKAFPSVQKVTSSHGKNKTEIIAEEELDQTALTEAINATGYQVTAIQTEPYKKKGFSLFGRK